MTASGLGVDIHVRQLAEWVAATSATDVPSDVQSGLRVLVADALGVTIRGSIEPQATRLWEGLLPARQATVLRPGFPMTSVADAAVANATSMCTLELDSGSRPSGHPMLHVLPVALAVAEAEDRTGAELEAALTVAYEAHARLQWAISLRPEVHAHGALAAMGATVAIGRLHGWDVDRLASGLSLAASLSIASSWRNALRDGSVRDLYAAAGASIALVAARACEAGFTAAGGMLEETFARILGQDIEPRHLSDDLGSRYWIREAYLKYHSACVLIHPVLDALGSATGASAHSDAYPVLTLESPPDVREIAVVRVWVPERSLKLDFEATSSIGARFSIPHMVAYFLVHGHSGPNAASPEALSDDRVRDLSRRVHVLGDPALSQLWPEHLAARVEIDLIGGTRLRGECLDPIGSLGAMASPELAHAKFTFLLDGLMPSSAGSALWEDAMRLGDLDRARSIRGRLGDADGFQARDEEPRQGLSVEVRTV